MATPLPRSLRSLTRSALWTLALLVGLCSLTPTAAAQALTHDGHSEADHRLSDLFIVEVGPDGTPFCRHATAEETEVLRAAPGEPLNFTVFTSTNAERDITGLRILLRATEQILEFPDALLAFRRAAARWERSITSPVTTVIDVDFGPRRFNTGTFAPTTLASATSGRRAFPGVGPAEIVDAMKEQHVGDAQLQALYDGIPIPTPSTAGPDLDVAVVSRPLAQAFGYLPAEADPDPTENPFGEFPTIGFNSAFSWDTDPSDGVPSGVFDFEAVAVHEMGHSLGFTSIIGNGGPPDNQFTVFDLFRVRPDAVEAGEDLDDGAGWEVAPRVTTPGPPQSGVQQVFFDGLVELPLSTATGGGQGGDGNQASHWRDDALGTPYIGIMDPNFASGTVADFNDNDLRAFEVMGYTVTYSPPRSDIAVTVQSVPYDTSPRDSVEYVEAGDFSVEGGGTLVVVLENTSASVPLDYEAELDPEFLAPAEAEIDVDFETSASGTIAPGESTEIRASLDADQRAVFYGMLTVETNAQDNLVIDIPFTFSVDGGTAPNLELATDDLGDLGNVNAGETTSTTFTGSNEGSVGLDFRTAVSFARRSFPFITDPDLGRGAGDVIFAEDFSGGGLGDFVAGGSFPGDWQVIDFGPATLGGHSTPNAVYFGQADPDEETLQYRNEALGTLLSPPIDVSGVAPEDLVVLRFNTYLQSELTGSGCPCDIASVLVSLDDGDSFIEVATSDGGLLQNTDAWEAIEIELPIFSGYPEPVRFAFQFVTDQLVTDLGWLIDDIVLTTRPGENSVIVTPLGGTISGDGEEEFTVSVQGDAFTEDDKGFYRGEIAFVSNSLEFSDAGVPIGFTDPSGFRFIGRQESILFNFAVGDPALPTLEPTAGLTDGAVLGVSSEASSGRAEFEVTNTGDTPLTFVRVLEPALSQYQDETARTGPARDFENAARGGASPGDLLGSAVVPATNQRAVDLAQLNDGRLAVLERSNEARIFFFDENFYEEEGAEPDTYTLPSFFDDETPTGLAYNERTGTLWIGVFGRPRLYELSIPSAPGELQRTGEFIILDFEPGTVEHSVELGAFFVLEYRTGTLHAVSDQQQGDELPGYPIAVPGNENATFRGLSLTGGLLEVGRENTSSTSLDQFGNEFPGSVVTEIPDSVLDGASRIVAFLRSRTAPNDAFYYVTSRGDSDEALIVAVDPPDLAEEITRTPVEAREPLFGEDLAPGESKTLLLRIDGQEAGLGSFLTEIAFLTNNEDDRVVRIPVQLGIYSVDNEGDASVPTAFALRPNYPNPFANRTRLAFDLPEAARVTISVYDVLGRRVSVVLDDEPTEAGEHTVSLDARGLTSGTYVVRLQAGDYVGSNRITVVR